MKKLLFGLIAVIIILIVYKKDGIIIIPSEAIRIRIIANSNGAKDLFNKKKIRIELEEYLYQLLENVDNISEARDIIKSNYDNISSIINSNGIKEYTFNYGLNFFPKKTYHGVIYQQGEYESLEIKLGQGIGDNYWCVLFPPLCLINENDYTDDVSYQLYLKKVLKIDK